MGYISGQLFIGNYVLKIHSRKSFSTRELLIEDDFSCFLINRYAINPRSTTSTTKLEAYPVSGLETWAGLCVVRHFLSNPMVQPQPMQPRIPVSTNGKRVASLRPSSVSPYWSR